MVFTCLQKKFATKSDCQTTIYSRKKKIDSFLTSRLGIRKVDEKDYFADKNGLKSTSSVENPLNIHRTRCAEGHFL